MIAQRAPEASAGAAIAGNAVTCQICQTSQRPPVQGPSQWHCRMCGQEYRQQADGRSTIVLSDRQLTALRTQAGRDASGQSTLMKNWWMENEQPVGEDFLDWNKNMPSRQTARKLILDRAAAGEVKSVLEIAFGGLHEYRAMREQLKQLGVSYSGVDWTEKFVLHAQREFPESRWTQGDVVRGLSVEPADVVYTQHMFEHLPALEPAFSNLLRLSRKTFINIFFIPPKPFPNYEVVNWQKYPIYHNTYSIGHIEKISQAMGFACTWIPFEKNPELPGVGIGQDVLLVCERIAACE